MKAKRPEREPLAFSMFGTYANDIHTLPDGSYRTLPVKQRVRNVREVSTQKVFRCSETAILNYGPRNLAQYYWAKLNASNSVLYRGYNEQRKQRLRISKSSYYELRKSLVDNGLAKKTLEGHVRLLPIRDIRVNDEGKEIKHACTIPLNNSMSIKDIEDILRLKLMEMIHRQRLHGIQMDHAMRAFEAGDNNFSKRQKSKMIARLRVAMLEGKQQETETLILSTMWGTTGLEVEKSANEGWAPISGEKLSESLGMPKVTLWRWKQRMIHRGYIAQRDNVHAPPPQMRNRHTVKALMQNRDLVQKAMKGTLVFYGGTYFALHQASSYRMLMNYDSKK